MTMGELKRSQFFHPQSLARSIAPLIVIPIFGTPLIIYVYRGSSTVTTVVILILFWTLVFFSLYQVVQVYQRVLHLKTVLSNSQACLTADAYFNSTEPGMSKVERGSHVYYCTSHFSEKIVIIFSKKSTYTKLSLYVSEEARNNEFIKWLDGLGRAIREAEVG